MKTMLVSISMNAKFYHKVIYESINDGDYISFFVFYWENGLHFYTVV